MTLRRTLLIIASFLLIGAGCTGTVTVHERGSSSRDLKPSSHFVSFTMEKEFEPNTYRIPLGETLNFVNESDETMRPVSDGFFDSGQDFQKNEIYQFTFETLGTFRYHDASRPESTGTIVVVNE